MQHEPFVLLFKSHMQDLRRLLQRSSRTASRHFRAQLAQYGLSGSQATALLFLNERQGTTVRELGDALGADLATASAVVDRLMSQGWIRRETDPDDRRRARLLLSEEGQALIEPLMEASHRTNSLLLDALGNEQAAELVEILERLLERTSELSSSAKRDAGEAN